MLIDISINIMKEMEPRQRFVSSIKYYNDHWFGYFVRFHVFCAFLNL